MMQDIRFAVRSLRLSPGFTVVALLALALGIGVNSAMFSVVHAVLLRPMPYPQPDRLLHVVRKFPTGISPALSGLRFLKWADGADSFESAAAYDVLGSGMNLGGSGNPERVASIRVTPNFFRAFGILPRSGRGFSAEDGRPGASPVMVISHGLWQRRFGGDPGVVGRTVFANDTPYRIVGVMPPGFDVTPRADIWVPLSLQVDPSDNANAYLVVARLKPDRTRVKAEAEMASLHRSVMDQYPALRNDSESIALVPVRELLTADVRPALLILLGAVGLVLLIACGNVANLLLARATARTREIAVRMALGAAPRRIARQLLTESAVLALAGGALGLLLGGALLRLLVHSSPPDLPRLSEVGMDGTVVAVVLAASLLTALLFGLAPALQAARADVNRNLREQGRGASSGRSTRRLRGSLVVFEVALCLVLLVSATLLIRSFAGLLRTDPGFQPRDLLTFKVSLTPRHYTGSDQIGELARQLAGRLQAVPGVVAAAAVTSLPLELGPDLPFEVDGQRKPSTEGEAQWRAITPDYFRAMGVGLRAGRAFADLDAASAQPVVIINQTLARQYFAGRDPVGERITIGRPMGPRFADPGRQIVGVAADVKELGLDQEPPPTVYVPMAQLPPFAASMILQALPMAWMVRAAVPPLSLVPAIQDQVRASDRSLAVAETRGMTEIVNRSVSQRRFSALVLTLFAALALALAVIGVYGVIAYSVSQRRHEIGIRMALGASAGGTLRLVLGDTFRLAGLGVAVGLAVALAASRLLRGLLYGVSAIDPVTYALAAVALLGAAGLAGLIAARAALRVDPAISLQGG